MALAQRQSAASHFRSRAFFPAFVVGTVAALVWWCLTISLGSGLATLVTAPWAGLVAGGVSADRRRLLGWIGGVTGVFIGSLAANLWLPLALDVSRSGLLWVVAFTPGYALMVAAATYAQKAGGDGGAVRVATRTRLDRVAAVVLAAVGVLVSGSMAIYIAANAATLAQGGHAAGDLWWFVMAAGLPVVIGGLLALPPAWLLWHGRRGGGTFALLWVVPAAVSVAILVATSGPDGLWFPFSLIVPSVAVGAPTLAGLLLAGWGVGRER